MADIQGSPQKLPFDHPLRYLLSRREAWLRKAFVQHGQILIVARRLWTLKNKMVLICCSHRRYLNYELGFIQASFQRLNGMCLRLSHILTNHGGRSGFAKTAWMGGHSVDDWTCFKIIPSIIGRGDFHSTSNVKSKDLLKGALLLPGSESIGLMSGESATYQPQQKACTGLQTLTEIYQSHWVHHLVSRHQSF